MKVSETSITRHNASAVKKEFVAAAERGDTLLDLGSVTVADSSAVSLLLSWVRIHQKHGRQYSVVGMPDKMRSLMKLYGVDSLVRC